VYNDKYCDFKSLGGSISLAAPTWLICLGKLQQQQQQQREHHTDTIKESDTRTRSSRDSTTHDLVDEPSTKKLNSHHDSGDHGRHSEKVFVINPEGNFHQNFVDESGNNFYHNDLTTYELAQNMSSDRHDRHNYNHTGKRDYYSDHHSGKSSLQKHEFDHTTKSLLGGKVTGSDNLSKDSSQSKFANSNANFSYSSEGRFDSSFYKLLSVSGQDYLTSLLEMQIDHERDRGGSKFYTIREGFRGSMSESSTRHTLSRKDHDSINSHNNKEDTPSTRQLVTTTNTRQQQQQQQRHRTNKDDKRLFRVSSQRLSTRGKFIEAILNAGKSMKKWIWGKIVATKKTFVLAKTKLVKTFKDVRVDFREKGFRKTMKQWIPRLARGARDLILRMINTGIFAFLMNVGLTIWVASHKKFGMEACKAMMRSTMICPDLLGKVTLPFWCCTAIFLIVGVVIDQSIGCAQCEIAKWRDWNHIDSQNPFIRLKVCGLEGQKAAAASLDASKTLQKKEDRNELLLCEHHLNWDRENADRCGPLFHNKRCNAKIGREKAVYCHWQDDSQRTSGWCTSRKRSEDEDHGHDVPTAAVDVFDYEPKSCSVNNAEDLGPDSFEDDTDYGPATDIDLLAEGDSDDEQNVNDTSGEEHSIECISEVMNANAKCKKCAISKAISIFKDPKNAIGVDRDGNPVRLGDQVELLDLDKRGIVGKLYDKIQWAEMSTNYYANSNGILATVGDPTSMTEGYNYVTGNWKVRLYDGRKLRNVKLKNMRVVKNLKVILRKYDINSDEQTIENFGGSVERAKEALESLKQSNSTLLWEAIPYKMRDLSRIKNEHRVIFEAPMESESWFSIDDEDYRTEIHRGNSNLINNDILQEEMLPTSGEVPFDGSGSSPDSTDALVHNGEVTAVQAGHEAATSSEKKVQNAVADMKTVAHEAKIAAAEAQNAAAEAAAVVEGGAVGAEGDAAMMSTEELEEMKETIVAMKKEAKLSEENYSLALELYGDKIEIKRRELKVDERKQRLSDPQLEQDPSKLTEVFDAWLNYQNALESLNEFIDEVMVAEQLSPRKPEETAAPLVHNEPIADSATAGGVEAVADVKAAAEHAKKAATVATNAAKEAAAVVEGAAFADLTTDELQSGDQDRFESISFTGWGSFFYNRMSMKYPATAAAIVSKRSSVNVESEDGQQLSATANTTLNESFQEIIEKFGVGFRIVDASNPEIIFYEHDELHDKKYWVMDEQTGDSLGQRAMADNLELQSQINDFEDSDLSPTVRSPRKVAAQYLAQSTLACIVGQLAGLYLYMGVSAIPVPSILTTTAGQQSTYFEHLRQLMDKFAEKNPLVISIVKNSANLVDQRLANLPSKMLNNFSKVVQKAGQKVAQRAAPVLLKKTLGKTFSTGLKGSAASKAAAAKATGRQVRSDEQRKIRREAMKQQKELQRKARLRQRKLREKMMRVKQNDYHQYAAQFKSSISTRN